LLYCEYNNGERWGLSHRMCRRDKPSGSPVGVEFVEAPMDASAFICVAFAIVFIAFAIGIPVLVVFLIMHSKKVAKQRQDALRRVARELRFHFYPSGDADLQSSLQSFHLFQQGSGRQLINLLSGNTRNLEVNIFDYHYTTGSGEDSHTSRQTVVSFEDRDLNLPVFGLRPKSIWAKIGSMFGYQVITFDSHPRFNEIFLVRGPDEGAIRDLFTPKVLDFLEEFPNICIEADGSALLFYWHGDLVRPEEIRDRMDNGFEVLSVFRENQ
jgi:hypothetical protein